MKPIPLALALAVTAVLAANAVFADPEAADDGGSAMSAETPVHAIAERHLTCFMAWDVECLQRDWGRGAPLVTKFRPLRKPDEIRAYLSEIFDELSQPEAGFEMELESVEGETANFVWSATRAEGLRQNGSHSFRLKNGKIGIVITSIDIPAETFFAIQPKKPASSSPEDFIALGGRALFFADDGISGEELWTSDGTKAGTRRLKDLNPGPGDSRLDGWARLDGALYFCSGTAQPPGMPVMGAAGLWRTDGTEEGTVKVKAMRLSCDGETTFAATDKLIFFVGSERASGRELWVSDGTEAGTRLVQDIRKGPEGSKPNQLFAFDGSVYFQADDGRGPKLWKSDGTRKGTVILKDLKGGYDGWHWAFAEFRGELYFTADDGRRGGELWKSNGTPGGTKLVKDIRPGKKGSQLFELNELGGVAYFSATDGSDREVWRTDGTTAGTFSLNVNPTDSSYPDHMRVSGGKAYFYAWNKAHGGELWAADGSVAGTYIVKDIFKGPKGSHPNLLVDLDGTLVFVAEDAEHGMELWRSDGTARGTVMLRDIEPGPPSGRPRYLARVGPRVFFQADDGAHGVELWATDGTPEGTVLVKNINRTGDE